MLYIYSIKRKKKERKRENGVINTVASIITSYWRIKKYMKKNIIVFIYLSISISGSVTVDTGYFSSSLISPALFFFSLFYITNYYTNDPTHTRKNENISLILHSIYVPWKLIFSCRLNNVQLMKNI